MLTSFKTTHDIEESIVNALEEFSSEHSRKPHYLVLGRLAYEELRDMMRLGNASYEETTHYKNLEIAVVEEPAKLLTIACKPD